jgi:DedD protein
MAEQQQDVDTLKRRGRRRLVGAVALVLLAVIVLPMVFDPEPRRSAPPVSVRIPGEDDSAFTPKVTPRPPEKKAEEKKPEPKAALEEKKALAQEKKAIEQEKKAIEPKAEPKPPAPKATEAERTRAEAALAGGAFIVPVGAFANPDAVIAKLAEAKMKHYTEKVPTAKGTVTRVRAGPFATRDEADKALETLKSLGLKPGTVGTKPG